MKKSEWNDEQLEHLLSQMPIVKDNRDPREIYQSISSKVKRKKKNTWIIPSLATAAALALIVLIGPSFLNTSFDTSQGGGNQESSSEDINMTMVTDAPKEENGAPKMTTITNDDSANRELAITSIEEPASYVIRDYMDKKLFTFGVPDPMVHTVIPVSVLVDWSDQSHIGLLPDVIQKVNDKLISSEYNTQFPLAQYTFTEKQNEDGTKNIILDFGQDRNPESFASAESMAFWGAVKETFRWFDDTYKEIEFHQNGKQGVMIGQSGIVETSYKLEKAGKRAYFMYVPFENGRKFLVPNEVTGKSSTFSDALETMRNNIEIGSFVLQPTILQSVNFEIDETDSQNATITFTEDTILENSDTFVFMIEAIMLTAKEFGYQTVTFNNANIDFIGSWDLTGVENTVPIAPNPITLD
ncbi:hypothetical protein IMZ08_20015 [Bacillus luteolus]|uniref:Uncharacterized protein n=1 Tax=Litchfieldia luteola TaxID=682179 RepID=A0ABR9QPE7_9BACI|nr:hypothetical protein [Cytobacillus luteolus]MBE4910329.1 hypothetical protein [Cytobacillus luteolus]MBP1942096.1 hypothetical protein [Cytobacillus luteolus]